jgi:hypothetical protein
VLQPLQFTELHEQMRRSGGFTVDPKTGTQPQSGISVALAAHERVIYNNATKAGDLERFAKDRAGPLSRPGAHFGTWADTDESGHDYLDVAMVTPSNERFPILDKAVGVTESIKHGQKAAYNLGTGVTIPNPYYGMSKADAAAKVKADYEAAAAPHRKR